MKPYSLVVIACLLVFATAFGADKEQKSFSKKRVDLSGQVFVVTNGRENVKLALVEVSAIPEKAVMDALKANGTEGHRQQEAIAAQLEAAKQDAITTRSAAKRAQDAFDSSTNISDFSTLNNANFVAAKASVDSREKVRDLEQKLRYYSSGAYLFEGLPSPVVTSKTDADGKFLLSIPAGRYVIAARSNRKVFNSTENYYWLVVLNTASPNHSLMLSNDNLFETKCNECVHLD